MLAKKKADEAQCFYLVSLLLFYFVQLTCDSVSVTILPIPYFIALPFIFSSS